jgi:hypothetical protein
VKRGSSAGCSLNEGSKVKIAGKDSYRYVKEAKEFVLLPPKIVC